MSEPPAQEILPAVQRVKIGILRIYEVSESELQQLEQGSPESLFLNFALALLSAAMSIFGTLMSTTIDSIRVFIVLIVITTVGFISGLVLLALWWRSHRSVRKLLAEIRYRPAVNGIRQDLPNVRRYDFDA